MTYELPRSILPAFPSPFLSFGTQWSTQNRLWIRIATRHDVAAPQSAFSPPSLLQSLAHECVSASLQLSFSEETNYWPPVRRHMVCIALASYFRRRHRFLVRAQVSPDHLALTTHCHGFDLHFQGLVKSCWRDRSHYTTPCSYCFSLRAAHRSGSVR